MHVTSNPAIWYAARASGVAAYVVLSLVVSLGLGLGGKAQSRAWPRFSIEDVHRFGGLLAGSLIGIHVLTIAADSFLPFSLMQLLVPFTSSYRPLWTGLGIAAAEILVALAITNHYRRRLPYSFWRKAHYLNFAVWALASIHGLMAGTDRGAMWLALIYATSVAVVAALSPGGSAATCSARPASRPPEWSRSSDCRHSSSARSATLLPPGTPRTWTRASPGA
jgi:predicted ferric reductase